MRRVGVGRVALGHQQIVVFPNELQVEALMGGVAMAREWSSALIHDDNALAVDLREHLPLGHAEAVATRGRTARRAHECEVLVERGPEEFVSSLFEGESFPRGVAQHRLVSLGSEGVGQSRALPAARLERTT